MLRTKLYIFPKLLFLNIWKENLWNISINKLKIDTESFDLDIKVEGHQKMFFGKQNYDFLYVGYVYYSSILRDKEDIER